MLGQAAEAALKEAARRGLLKDGEPYARAALLAALTAAGELPARALRHCAQLTRAARIPGKLGTLSIEAAGQRGGRTYRLTGLLAPASTPQGSPDSHGALEIHYGDNLPILERLPRSSFDLIYIDPPFNTGTTQTCRRIRAVGDPAEGDRTGFMGRRYRSIPLSSASFADTFDDYLAFLAPRLEAARPLLKPSGALFLHIDYREAHYCKVLLDQIFGRSAFQNEIIWAYDYGARSRRRWPAKHDTLLWYTKDPERYTFNYAEMDRIPYLAPRLAGEAKRARGKTPTDVWWHTIVPTSGRERTGYPTQKPLGILDRILKVHTHPGDRILDFFAGSGTTGASAARLGRHCTLIDNNPQAIETMAHRLAFAHPTFIGWPPGPQP